MAAIIDSALINVKLLKAPKTQDQDFNDANTEFEKMKIDSNRVINLVNTFDLQVKSLTENVRTLLTSVVTWAKDTTPATQKEFSAALNVSIFYEAITITSLLMKMEPSVIQKLKEYNDEVQKVTSLRNEREKVMKVYDKDKERVKLMEETKKQSADQILKAKQQLDESEAKYQKANMAFLDGVNDLKDIYQTQLIVPFQNFSGILGQYLTQMTTNVPKFCEVEIKDEDVNDVKNYKPADWVVKPVISQDQILSKPQQQHVQKQTSFDYDSLAAKSSGTGTTYSMDAFYNSTNKYEVKGDFSSDSSDAADYVGNPFSGQPKKKKEEPPVVIPSSSSSSSSPLPSSSSSDDDDYKPQKSKPAPQPKQSKPQKQQSSYKSSGGGGGKKKYRFVISDNRNPEEKVSFLWSKKKLSFSDSHSSGQSSSSSKKSGSSYKSGSSSKSKSKSKNNPYDDDDGWDTYYDPGVVNKSSIMASHAYYEPGKK